MELKYSKKIAVASKQSLTSSEKLSIYYHSIFNYPLKNEELKKWSCKYKKTKKLKEINIKEKDGFYFIKGKSKDIITRITNEKYSIRKRKIAERASKIISILPTILFVGITGSLAMNNANKNSDIDLIIVTKKNTLWLTRPVVYLLLLLNNFRIRKPKTKDEKDKLCLNMWLDERSLVWDKNERNIFTAHEMVQIVPLLNKYNIYAKIMTLNSWALSFWPNSIKRFRTNKKVDKNLTQNLFLKLVNIVFMFIQKIYMKNKQTKEYISESKALFHPINNSSFVVNKFENYK